MDTGNPILPPVNGPAVDPTQSRPADATAAHKTGEDFEAFFLSQVFEHMFNGVGSDALFGGGQSETIYRSLLLQQYSKVAAKSGGVGLADAVQREILRAQEVK
jgi:Rod binding domain-containing protein